MFGHRAIRTSAAAALVLLLVACSPCRRGVLGFPLYGQDVGPSGITRVSDRIMDEIDLIQVAIDKRAPSTEGQVESLHHEAYQALVAAHLSIANETLDYLDPPQLDTPPYPPLIIHPRLTAPAIIEPKLLRTKDGPQMMWVVPVIVNKDAMYFDLSPDVVWLGESPRRHMYNTPLAYLRGWWIRAGEMDITQRNPVCADQFLHELDPLTVKLSDGSDFTLPDIDQSHEGFVGAVPVAGPGGGKGLEPGFYSIQLFPRIMAKGLRCAWGKQFGAALAEGDWYLAFDLVKRFPGANAAGGAANLEHDLLAVVKAIEDWVPTRFDRQLDPVRSALQHWAWSLPDPKNANAGPPSNVIRQLSCFVLRSHQPAQVFLDEPGKSNEPFSFVAGGDLQLHTNPEHAHRFLRMVDGWGYGIDPETAKHMDADVIERMKLLKFIIIAGDLADGEGLSSEPHTAIVAGLGLHPPLSPYDVEMPLVRNELEEIKIPFVAVPGNHDGFASYGGVVNTAFDWVGQVLKWPPAPIRYLTHPVGHGLQQLGQQMPVLVKIGRLNRHPYFDGLIRWQYEFGPLNTGFTYRGCSFLAFNSYNTPQLYRDQVGPLANNWGGGVGPGDAVWFDVMTRYQRRKLLADPVGNWRGHQFVFMHHDPRAAVPDPKGSGKEIGAGQYDGSDAPVNTLTFGWLGLDYSSLNPLFVPVVTPIGTNVRRLLTTGDRFNQEWMGPAWDADRHCHHARALIETVNTNLSGPAAPEGGISHVFFAHNDEVAEGMWAQADQGNHVFRRDPCQRWTGCPYRGHEASRGLFRTRTEEPFAWGREMTVPEGRNARVIRVDDIGDNGSESHGFHLVTVYPQPDGRPPVIKVTNVPIPPGVPSTKPTGPVPGNIDMNPEEPVVLPALSQLSQGYAPMPLPGRHPALPEPPPVQKAASSTDRLPPPAMPPRRRTQTR